MGFISIAPTISPFGSNKTARVDPHDGHGIPVAFLKTHISNPENSWSCDDA